MVMISQKRLKPVPRISRRAALGSLAGGVTGLALLQVTPVAALSRGTTRNTSAVFTRGQTLYAYKGLPASCYTVDWSPDGSRIVVSGSDNQGNTVARAWDALTGQNVVTFSGDGYIVYSGEWSPDGTRIASGAGSVGKIWNRPIRGGPEL